MSVDGTAPPRGAQWFDQDAVGFQARLRPSKTACIELASGEGVTYQALDRLISSAAGLIRSLVKTPGARVAVVARNSLDHILAAYGCERAGAIYVPLNWRLSASELAVLMEDCEPEILILDEEFARAATAAARGKDLPTFLTGSGGERFRDAVLSSAPARAAPGAPEATTTLLYTSGTTGRPKGVIVTRQGAFWSSFNFTALGEIGPGSVVLCDAPMFHTVGQFAVARTALFNGARLLISDRFLPETSLERLSDPDVGVTHYFGVPQMAQAIADLPGFAGSRLGGLRGFFVGGAPLSPTLARIYLDKGVPLSNGFGMSEAASVAHLPLDLEAIASAPTAVGVPAPAVELRLVTAEGREAEGEEVGEIWLRGPAISPGYWRQPEATAKAFSEGWFRTGDAARRRADGFLEIVDRWKDMYITGGENVYPAEVEAALLALEGVFDVAVVGVPDERWGECGWAFVVPRPGADVSLEMLQACCRERLARYKHPSQFRFLDALPRTASGKVRKDELRQTIGR